MTFQLSWQVPIAMDSSGGVIEMPCLGRPFRLGMLYDCRSDKLIPGITLWDNEKLEAILDSKPQIGSDFEVIAEDNLDTKASKLDIGGSLKLSLMGGLVNVSGSAKYLNDHTSSKHQSRVSLKYSSTSKFDQLTMNQLALGNIQYPDVFSNKLATHLVSAVLYGADAFLVFNRNIEDGETVGRVHGKVEALVKGLSKILDIKGQASLTMDEKEKNEASKLECKFHGDISLPKNPRTFQDAVQVFQQLPALLKGEADPVAVPKKVWLHPLINLNSTAAKVVHEISISLASHAQKVMEKLFDYEVQCNDLKETEVCSSFSGLQKHVSQFKGMISQYKMEISRKLAQLLPTIREGGIEESQLAQVFESNEASPFSIHHLETWLNNKTSEVKILGAHIQCLSKVPYIRLALKPGDLDEIVNNPEYEYIVCLTFCMLTSDDVVLSQMQAYLDKQCSGKLSPGDLWFKDETIVASLKKHVKHFTTFAKANEESTKVKFVVTDDSDKVAGNGSAILLFNNGKSKEFNIPARPENVKVSPNGVTETSICFEWSKPEHGSESVQHYTTRYGLSGEPVEKWKTKKTIGNETNITLEGLQSGKEYCIEVYLECEAGVSKYSKVSDPICTIARLAVALKIKSDAIPNESGPPAVYKLRVKKINLPGKMLQKVSIGKRSKCVEEKILMVVGATGAGKTTLINGMVNYILGVKWKDNFRFKLITEEPTKEAYSKTKAITAYTIHHMQGSPVDYHLTIIDTPGFGDTSGLKQDVLITEQIKDFFSVPGRNGISHLNGIGFVTQAALARLTPTQQYICDSILSIFGKDVSENIFMMLTFADGHKPPVISAIEEANIPYSGCFKFNNSALFAEPSSPVDDDDDDEDNFDEMYWKMGANSFKKFFTAFQVAESVSLSMTRDVLQLRDRLQTIVIGLQRQMQACLAKMETLHQEKIALQAHEADIIANKEFTVEVKVANYEVQKLQRGEYVTNCIRCSSTCHYPCKIPDDDNKFYCGAMEDGNCTICKDRCVWSEHKNTGTRFVLVYQMVQRTLDELKMKFDCASNGKAAVEEMIASHNHQLEEAHAELHEMIDESRQCLERLDEIALKPNPLSQVEYIQLLIETEKHQGKEGWLERVKYLEDTKMQASFLAGIKNANDADQQIEEVKRKQEPGWEEEVETLEKMKRIKSEVDKIQEDKESNKIGIWGVIKNRVRDGVTNVIQYITPG